MTTAKPVSITTQWYIPELDCISEKKLIANKLKKMADIECIAIETLDHKLLTAHPENRTETLAAAITSLGFSPQLISINGEATGKKSVPAAHNPDLPVGWISGTWKIKELCCPDEELLITKSLKKQKNIRLLTVNLLTNEAVFAYPKAETAKVNSFIRSLGFNGQQQNLPVTVAKNNSRRELFTLAAAGIFAAAALLLELAGYNKYIIALFAVAAILCCGLDIFKNAFIALKNKTLTINFLMSVAVVGAFIMGEYPEAAMVMFLFCLAEFLESFSVNRARRNIKGLLDTAPKMITVQTKDKVWTTIPVENAKISMRAQTRPGDTIALDGIITKGGANINEASITGESVAVAKTVGARVFAGTINEDGSFEYEITATAAQTTLAKIIDMVENAQAGKAATQRFIDRFVTYYIPAIFIAALILALVIPLFLGNWTQWLYNGLVLLVISCPCALVIATPITLLSGLTLATKNGILIKGGVFLETATAISCLAMDKTGTITYGKPQVIAYLTDAKTAKNAPIIAASLSSLSTHPLSTALVRYHAIKPQGLAEVTGFTNISGMGIKGTINDTVYYLVNPRYLTTLKITVDKAMDAKITAAYERGETVLMLCGGGKIIAVYTLLDEIKPESAATMQALAALKVKTVMITGDNDLVSKNIAAKAGISEYYSQRLPADKLNIIEEKMRSGDIVAMAGDGINDAPALAQANLGIAMGKLGSDVAIETADVVIMDDKLNKVVDLIKISKKTKRILQENIAFAVGVKFAFIILTLLSLSSMWGAVFADVGATLLVILNGLRPLLSLKTKTDNAN